MLSFVVVFVIFCYLLLLSRTIAGRGRAWLRFVLMQKKLADNFRHMTEDKRKLRYLWVCGRGYERWGGVMCMILHGRQENLIVRGCGRRCGRRSVRH